MIQRCTNPKSKSYENYGGRGIKVCDRWLTFKNFLEHYEVEKAPWWKFQGWPKIKGFTVIPMAPLRKI
jgi:hypothetical protein